MRRTKSRLSGLTAAFAQLCLCASLLLAFPPKAEAGPYTIDVYTSSDCSTGWFVEIHDTMTLYLLLVHGPARSFYVHGGGCSSYIP